MCKYLQINWSNDFLNGAYNICCIGCQFQNNDENKYLYVFICELIKVYETERNQIKYINLIVRSNLYNNKR